MSCLIKSFIDVFSDILKETPKKLNDKILRNRLMLYTQLVKETEFGSVNFTGNKIEKYYNCITEIFLNSKKQNKIVEFVSIDKIPLVLNAFEMFLFYNKLTLFEINLLVSFYEGIEEFTEYATKENYLYPEAQNTEKNKKDVYDKYIDKKICPIL